jgi:hypothetical protein
MKEGSMASEWVVATSADKAANKAEVYINLASVRFMQRLQGLTRIGFGGPDDYIDVNETPQELVDQTPP